MRAFSDSYGRQFNYLRLSVTDRCNFRCVYCLPEGYKAPAEAQEPELSVEEIYRLCSGFGALGFTKIRLTGGEPTVRRDLPEIVAAASSVPGIRTVALTTNGHNLSRIAFALKEAGLRAVNVSLDSLDPGRFKAVTGSDRFREVVQGIDRALEAGIETVKVNAVLLRGITDLDMNAFLEWVRERPVTVRFIELMRTGKNGALFDDRHLGGGELQLLLRKTGWVMAPKRSDGGPAHEFSHPHSRGKIGIIAPYSEHFCQGCNRLRVSSRGELKLCLFGEEDVPLRQLLRSANYARAVADHVIRTISRKPESHLLREGKYGKTWNLSSIGG